MVTIFVEGGGDGASLKAECRRAFSELIEKAGFKNKMPSIVACGGRGAAFDGYKDAFDRLKPNEFLILLVDSETVPRAGAPLPWVHLKSRDGWDQPHGSADENAHLMVVCMETWLLSDPDCFSKYFGKDFKKSKLPTTDLENRSKDNIYSAIASATASSKPKRKYGKARDSFELLGRVDVNKLRNTCPWADRFFKTLETKC